MWSGLFLLVFIMIITWWLLAQNVRQSQEETLIQHESHQEDHAPREEEHGEDSRT